MEVSDAPPAVSQRTVGEGRGVAVLSDYCVTSLRRRTVRTAMRASPATSR